MNTIHSDEKISSRLSRLRDNLIKNGKVIPGTTDTMFKIVMTSCKSYLTFLISEFININESDLVKKIIIQNNELPLSNAKERKKISDFIAKVDKSLINFEMNSEYFDGLLIRNQAYLGKIEGESFSDNDKKEYISIINNIFKELEDVIKKNSATTSDTAVISVVRTKNSPDYIINGVSFLDIIQQIIK